MIFFTKFFRFLDQRVHFTKVWEQVNKITDTLSDNRSNGKSDVNITSAADSVTAHAHVLYNLQVGDGKCFMANIFIKSNKKLVILFWLLNMTICKHVHRLDLQK